MIRITSAMLADAATMREGLLHVLGGGISLLSRPNYPAPIGASLALLLEARDIDLSGQPVELDIVAKSEEADHAQLFEAKVSALIMPPPGGERILNFPVAIDLTQAGIPAPGLYKIVISLNGRQETELYFEGKQVEMGSEFEPWEPWPAGEAGSS